VQALFVPVGYYISPSAGERGKQEPVGENSESFREGFRIDGLKIGIFYIVRYFFRADGGLGTVEASRYGRLEGAEIIHSLQ